MPLPLLFPVIAIGAAALSGLGGSAKLVSSGLSWKEANHRLDDRRKRYDASIAKLGESEQATQGRLNQLCLVRQRATRTLGKAADFLKKAKVKDRTLLERINISPEQLGKWEADSFQGTGLLTAVAKGGASGAAAASGASSLVATFAAASTGTAISSLSGAAAANATLAWLGGGALAAGGGGMALGSAVLGSLVIGPAVLVTGFVMDGKAQKHVTDVEKVIAKIDVAEAIVGKQLTILDALRKRVVELMHSTAEMDATLEVTLRKANPHTLKDAFRVAKLAKSLGAVLDVVVLGKGGNIA